jgi:hypothetical protein
MVDEPSRVDLISQMGEQATIHFDFSKSAFARFLPISFHLQRTFHSLLHDGVLKVP